MAKTKVLANQIARENAKSKIKMVTNRSMKFDIPRLWSSKLQKGIICEVKYQDGNKHIGVHASSYPGYGQANCNKEMSRQ